MQHRKDNLHIFGVWVIFLRADNENIMKKRKISK